MNGTELILDADGDTSITADTDDQIDIKIGGTDIVTFTNSSSNFVITQAVQDKSITFKGDDNGSPVTALILDMADAGTAVFNHDITLDGKITGASQVTQDVDTSSLALAGGTDSNVGANMIVYGGSHSSLAGVVRFRNGSTNTARIDSSGNLFVGKTSSGSANVGFEYNNGGQLAVTRSGDTVALLNRTSSDGAILDFRKDNTLVGSIKCNNGNVDIVADGSSNDVRLLSGQGAGFRTGTSGGNLAMIPLKNSADSDNTGDLGISSVRFDDIFATNGTIQTSDQNEKEDIASATTKELNVAKKLSALFKTFRWKDKVAEKGDKARTHTGIVAQEVQTAFKAEGLDASNYGLFTSDTWWEKEISVDAVKADKEKGIEAKDAYTYKEYKYEKTDGYTERTRLGVRYPELFSFIFSSIEARLTALESK
jgi:hypothetical protein